MAQTKILVDTNSYLRLAKSLHPLLFTPFGVADYCLYVIPELNRELAASHLRTKFPWVGEPEFIEERKHFPTISRKQKKAIEETLKFVWDYVESDLPGPSKVDARFIAYALELEIPVVTDDDDMTHLAKAFGAGVMNSLELLKLMVEQHHIDMSKVRSIVAYWRYVNDTPGQLIQHYRRLFGVNPP